MWGTRISICITVRSHWLWHNAAVCIYNAVLCFASTCVHYHPLIFGWLSPEPPLIVRRSCVCERWWPSLIGMVNLVTFWLHSSQTQGSSPVAAGQSLSKLAIHCEPCCLSVCRHLCAGEGGQINLWICRLINYTWRAYLHACMDFHESLSLCHMDTSNRNIGQCAATPCADVFIWACWERAVNPKATCPIFSRCELATLWYI